jgi:hypothetical protein
VEHDERRGNEAHLAGLAQTLDATSRDVAARLPANGAFEVTTDGAGRAGLAVLNLSTASGTGRALAQWAGTAPVPPSAIPVGMTVRRRGLATGYA